MTSATLGNVRRGLPWLKARIEVLVPILGLPLFLLIAGQMGLTLTGFQTTLLWGAALVYAGLVVWSPMTLPAKAASPVTRARVVQATALVIGAVLGATLLQSMVYQPASGSGGGGGLRTLRLVLAVVLGTTGVLAEGTLPVDLFPVLRWRAARRTVYVVVAAFFLMVVSQLWVELFGALAVAIGGALGETPPQSGDVARYFEDYTPLGLLLTHLVSAGLEELLFRVGILTGVWALARRLGLGGRAAWLGLLFSALCFGLYHVTLSSLSGYFVQAPLTSVLRSSGAGLADGLIYRYRGYTAAVLVHALGNWLFLMMLMGAGG